MAAGYDGSIRIDTRLDAGGFNKGRRQIEAGLNGISVSLRKVAGAMGLALGVGALVRLGHQAVETASDLKEVQNVVDTAFGEMAWAVEDFADRALMQFGLSELQAKRTASTYMAMSNALGVSRRTAAAMAIDVAGLTGDLASFYNVSQSVADTALKSIWTGETESLKQFGVVMTQANLQQFAYQKGIRKNISAMTQAEQVTLRYQYVTEQLALAQGDFAKTSGSWANQTRILSEQFNVLLGILGSGLIAALTPALQFLNALMARLIALAQTVAAVLGALFGRTAEQQKGVTAAYNETASAAQSASDAAGGLAGSTKKAGQEAKKALASFDELNRLSEPTADAGAAGGGGVGDVGTIELPTIDATGAMDETLAEVNQKLLSFLKEWRDAAQPTVEAFKRLWEALKPLRDFTAQALIDFYRYFLEPVGKWVLGEGIPRFVDAISNGLATIDWTRLNGALATLWQALAPFSVSVGDGLLWLWENVLVPLGAWTISEVLPRFLELLAAMLEVLTSVIEALKPLAEWLFENFLRPLAEWTGGVILAALDLRIDALNNFSDWITENQGLVQTMTVLVAAFFAVWKVSELINFVTNAGGVVGALLKLKESIVATTAAKWLMTAATGAWNAICSIATAATTVFGAAVAFLTSPIGLVVAAIGALIAIIVLLVTHWDEVKAAGAKAWEGIQNAWKAAGNWFTTKVLDPIKNAFKAAFNGIISIVERALNGIIGKLNALSFNIPDWVPGFGGKHFGFNLRPVSIPRLATGAVIPPNREFAAILGDQTHGRNLEAPEGLIRQILREENDMTEVMFVLRDILDAVRAGKVLAVDQKVLAKVVSKAQTDAARRDGKTPIPV